MLYFDLVQSVCCTLHIPSNTLWLECIVMSRTISPFTNSNHFVLKFESVKYDLYFCAIAQLKLIIFELCHCPVVAQKTTE